MLGVLIILLTIAAAWTTVLIMEQGPKAIKKYKTYRTEVAAYKNSSTMPKLPKGYYWRIRTIPGRFYEDPKSIEVAIHGKKNYWKLSMEQEVFDESQSPEILAELIDATYASFKENTFVDKSLDNALNYYKGNKPKALGRKQDKL